jgi:hypothetical protein
VIGWKDLIVGGAAFVVAHLIEVEAWPWFDPAGASTPWFLNTDRATAFTAASLFVAAVIASASTAYPFGVGPIAQGCSIALGAILAMTLVLVVKGPGTLFPIVLFVGAAIAVASCVGGALVGRGLLSARRTRRT